MIASNRFFNLIFHKNFIKRTQIKQTVYKPPFAINCDWLIFSIQPSG